MNQHIKDSIWKQFGASIDMLENAIRSCPHDFWDTKQFWYMAYHSLFYLDYYLTMDSAKFSPPSPFTLSEFDSSGVVPDKTYSQKKLLTYLQYGRTKCYNLISALTDEMAASRWVNEYKNYSVFEILLYNMRHVQHHAAQLNLLLRQEINDAPKWVSQTAWKSE